MGKITSSRVEGPRAGVLIVDVLVFTFICFMQEHHIPVEVNFSNSLHVIFYV